MTQSAVKMDCIWVKFDCKILYFCKFYAKVKNKIVNSHKNQKNLNFLKFISSEKKEYAQSLLATVLEKEDYLLELIQPKFKNWDAERIATIDLTVLKMGVAELLYFPTIPTKVTINEYIEVAKQYSTEQSGQFVNGVLDNILKDLTKENVIRKIDRKK